MNKKRAQPPPDSMTSQKSCYYADCGTEAKWGIASSVEQKNPDGSPLTLFSCDDHYGELTTQLRDAGTRYTLFPVGGPHVIALMGPGAEVTEKEFTKRFDKELAKKPLLVRAFTKVAIAIVTVVISPFCLVYYGGKWLLGWRPGGK